MASSTTASTAATRPSSTTKIPPPPRGVTTSWRMAAVAAVGLTPLPSRAWEMALAVGMARPTSARLALAAITATTIRGAMSLAA